MGDGITIIPTNGKIYAPVDGEIATVSETLHAYGFTTEDGMEILVHVGLDSVELKGEEFTSYVQAGDKVKAGQLVAEVDLKFPISQGVSATTPVLICEGAEDAVLNTVTGDVKAGKTKILTLGEEQVAAAEAVTEEPAKKKGINFDFLQKLGKVLMTVIAVMPAAGIMLSLGKLLAMYRHVDADKKKNYRSMFVSTVLAVFLTGVTEPLEFMFMFCALPLYIVYALLQGCAFAMAGVMDLRLHSFGNLEFATRVPMSLKAGLGGDIINFILCCVAFLVIGYVVAYFMIKKFRYATPGRLGNYTDEGEGEEAAGENKASGNSQAERIIALLGGRENITLVDACMARLRVTVKDLDKVADVTAWKAEGALSLIKKDNGIQAVYGPKADVLKSDINDIL